MYEKKSFGFKMLKFKKITNAKCFNKNKYFSYNMHGLFYLNLKDLMNCNLIHH